MYQNCDATETCVKIRELSLKNECKQETKKKKKEILDEN